MQFVRPQLFTEAVAKLGVRSPVGAALSSAEWAAVPVALRERAFWAAKVQDARFLSDSKQFFDDFLRGTVETLPNGEKALKAGGRAQFIEQLQTYAVNAGMEPLDPAKRGGLQDPTSERRLGLIFDTNIKSAQDFGYWKQGQDPDLLDAFPAQRFIRVRDARVPRPDHRAHEGEVRLKTDLAYWIARNPFGVPWGPFGFGSGMDVEDESREVAEADGLLKPGEAVRPVEKDLNDHLAASARGMDPQVLARLKADFGDQMKITGDTIQWKGQPAAPEPGAGEDATLTARVLHTVRDEADVQVGSPRALATLVDQEARQQVLAEEARIATGRVERSLVFDARSGELLAARLGQAGRVSVPGGDARGQIVSHNHPAGSSFSPEDLKTACELALVELRVISAGHTFSLAGAFGPELRARLDRVFPPVAGRVLQTLRALVADGGITREALERHGWHAILMEICRDPALDLSYSRQLRPAPGANPPPEPVQSKGARPPSHEDGEIFFQGESDSLAELRRLLDDPTAKLAW